MAKLRSSRKEALALGHKFYSTGKPCIRGHIDKRWVVNWACHSCKLIRGSAWQDKNKEKISKRKKITYAKNPQKFINKTTDWQKKNPQKALNKQRVWRDKNWMRVISWGAKRRSLEGAKKYSFTDEFVQKLLNKQKGECVYCSKDLTAGFHIDHRKPLSRGGTNHKNNIQILCVGCNLSKATKTHKEFLVYRRKKIV